MNKFASGFVALGLMLILSGASRAEDRDCRAIIDKAIKAVGGEEQLTKHQAETFREKGTYYGEGAAQPYTGKYAVQFPDRFRMEIEGVFTIVLDGNRGWIAMGGNTQEMNKEQLAQQKESQYAGWVTTLLPLVKDKAFQLSGLGESKIGDRTVVGIKVTHPGHNEVKLYFDKESGLLVRSEYRYKDWMSGKDTEMVSNYENYKRFDGLKFPTKMEMKRDGKQFVEAEIEEVKPVEKFDVSIFAKP
jgi:outer membrane lipoprotein-sorting protein